MSPAESDKTNALLSLAATPRAQHKRSEADCSAGAPIARRPFCFRLLAQWAQPRSVSTLAPSVRCSPGPMFTGPVGVATSFFPRPGDHDQSLARREGRGQSGPGLRPSGPDGGERLGGGRWVHRPTGRPHFVLAQLSALPVSGGAHSSCQIQRGEPPHPPRDRRNEPRMDVLPTRWSAGGPYAPGILER